MKGTDTKQPNFVKVVKAYKSDKGAWRFRTKMVELNDENKAEIYK
jgi:hypothetical protein